MTDTSRWSRYLRVWGPDPVTEIDEELAHHFELREQELLAAGLSPDEARREAARAFGDRARIEHELHGIGRRRLRRTRRARYIDELRADVRHTRRAFARHPAVPLVLLVTLSLGIGASTAVFSLVRAVVLNPIPVQRPHELQTFYEAWGTNLHNDVAYPMFKVLREHSTTLSGMAAYTSMSVGVRAGPRGWA